MTESKVSVVIPAFNESQTIGELIREIQQRYPDFEIVVVDDGSADNTATVAADTGAIVLSHPYNIGNGAAIKTGIRAATGDILVFMDGDGQHNPEDIAKMLEHMPEFDMVVGARVKGSQTSVGRGIGNMIYIKIYKPDIDQAVIRVILECFFKIGDRQFIFFVMKVKECFGNQTLRKLVIM